METKEFKLDRVFGPEDDNHTVYESVAAGMVEYVIDGGSACCIAYGQTGSGKTHTQSSLQLTAAKDLFSKLGHEQSLALTYYENCGDDNYDLLDGEGRGESLPVREDGDGGIHVVGLTQVDVVSEDDLLRILHSAVKRRATAGTAANDTSSRSHAICTFIVLSHGEGRGSMRVVDLAGSERKEDMVGHDMDRIEETKLFNCSC